MLPLKHTIVLMCLIIIACPAESGSSRQKRDITSFFSNIGHAIKSMFTGSRVTLSGSSGPTNHRVVSKDSRDIRYLLYNNRLNISDFVDIPLDNYKEVTDNLHIAKGKSLKILIHGFNSSANTRKFPQETKDAYLEKTDNDVILVDWGKLSKPEGSLVSKRNLAAYYNLVVKNVRRAGENVGKFILQLNDAGGTNVSLKDIHVIGFSLGAHVAGYAGQYVNRKGNETIGRITGLDPAGPKFSDAQDMHRLDKSDSDFVDIVHTSPLGLQSQIGHADFFPNGGSSQPNCTKPKWDGWFQDIQNFFTLKDEKCGHGRAAKYFTQSIRLPPEELEACQCESWKDYLSTCRFACPDITIFGEHCPKTTRGKFFMGIGTS